MHLHAPDRWLGSDAADLEKDLHPSLAHGKEEGMHRSLLPHIQPLLAILCILGFRALGEEPSLGAPLYHHLEQPSRDGIGKVYQGREISQVMGHLGASWLERSERSTEERPDLLVKALGLQPGQVVADIGAGSGYFTRRLAKAVGPTGWVFAVDIQPEMLTILDAHLADQELRNVSPILGSVDNPRLPSASVDLVLMVDVYHEFEFPHEMMQSIKRCLKPAGKVVWVEYRAEDPTVPIKERHKMTESQIKKEAAFQGFQWAKTLDTLPWQHVAFFGLTSP